MSVEAKICGINAPEALEAAVKGGAALFGLNFYPPSPRAVTTDQAAALADRAPPGVKRVGLFVDPDDALLETILARVPLDLLQLHGQEAPRRVAEIRPKCLFSLSIRSGRALGPSTSDLMTGSHPSSRYFFISLTSAPESIGRLPGMINSD